MKPEELSDHIAEIDDELIAAAKKRPVSHRKIILIAGSVAACAVIAVTAVFFAARQGTGVETSVPVAGGYTEMGAGQSSGITTAGGVSEIPHTEESYDTDIEIITSEIFYVKDSKIEKTPAEHEATPQAVFELWKRMNNIGDEVKLLSVKIESNGITEESEIDGQGVATYHVGDKNTYILTITKNIEDCYSRVDKDLLLESLKQTMLSAADIKSYGNVRVDEYKLILAEG